MLNQAAVEALYSANYIENYLDYVENVPMEISRYVSRVRELDLTHVGLLKEIEQHTDTLLHDFENTSQKKNLLTKTQQALIWTQEIGDEKLRVMQQVQDLIENKTRQLDLDYRNLADVGKESDVFDAPKDSGLRDSLVPLPLNNGLSAGERQSKRVRRTRTDLAVCDQSPLSESVAPPEPQKQPQHNSQQSTPTNSAVATSQKKSNIAMGKKKKRKNRQSTQQTSQKDSQMARDRDSSPPREDDGMADPDEPRYCLCDQISYGEMIMCDNDLCPFEWFHFACVSLGVKPKGKWYCPTCRGDRSSIMKPKSQLLKELERLKQEREARDEKSS